MKALLAKRFSIIDLLGMLGVTAFLSVFGVLGLLATLPISLLIVLLERHYAIKL